MAQFESGIVQVNSSVGTVASQVWNPSNSSSTTFGSLGSVPSGATLSGLIVANTGSNTIYLASGSLAAASATGIPVAPGGEVYLSAYSATQSAPPASGTIWAQTSVVGQTSSTQSGLPSVASVI